MTRSVAKELGVSIQFLGDFPDIFHVFSIDLKGLKVILSLSDRYKIFTTDWLLIEVCQKVVLSKTDITMATIN